MAPIQSKEYSLLEVERISQYVSLPPASLTSPLPAICASIFSPLLLTYYPPAKGVVLAYEDVQLSDQPPRSTAQTDSRKRRGRRREDSSSDGEDEEEEDGVVLLRQIDEYSSPFVWATASLLVWRPRENAWLRATITHQSSTHITLSHLNTFPITILHDNLPQGWEWHTEQANKKKTGWDGRIADEGGWWVDAEVEQVQSGTEVEVRIREWDARGGGEGKRGFLRIEGSLVTVEVEKEMEERRRGKRVVGNGVEREGQMNGEVIEVE